MQTVEEYMSIINDALEKEFGILYVIGKSYSKILKFSFDNSIMADDDKKILCDKAARNILKAVDLPSGIYLKECNIKVNGGF